MRTATGLLFCAGILLAGTIPAQAVADLVITGTVVDKDGPLPGALVELSGGGLEKPIAMTTDVNGVYRFKLLAPGIYSIKATFADGNPVTVHKIEVKGNSKTKETIVDPISLYSESVQVEAEAGVAVEQDSTTTGETLESQTLQDVPTERSYTEVIKFAPGVSGDDGSGGQSVYGSTGLESSYIIDGINTTSIESGKASKNISFDLIDKIEIKTGGYEAEYGGAQGAIVNVVTKSGGNEFEGSLGYYVTPNSLAAPAEQNGYGTEAPSPDNRELAASLGGFLVRDKLFFFGAVSQKTNTSIADQRFPSLFGREVAESREDADLYSFKLTWHVSTGTTLTAVLISDPTHADRRDELGGIGGDHQIQSGGTDASIRLTSIVNPRWYLEGGFGTHVEGSDISPTDDSQNFYPAYTSRNRSTASVRARVASGPQVPGEPSLRFGPYAYSGDTDAKRDFANFAMTTYPENHAIKIGTEMERGDFRQELDYGWGTGMALEWSPAVISHATTAEQIIGVRRCWGDGQGNCLDWDHQIQAHGGTEVGRVFVQDQWKATPNLTLSYGLRWEMQKIQDASGASLGDVHETPSPRFGLTWDVIGGGKSKLYASVGRYYDSVPMQVVSRAFSPRVTYTRLYRGRDWTYLDFWNDISNTGICETNDPSDDNAVQSCWDFESADLAQDPTKVIGLNDNVHTSRGVGTGSSLFRPDTIVNSGSLFRAPIDENLQGAHNDEAILGFDWRFREGWSAGVRFVGRELGDAIEDVSLDFGRNYIITNPGGPYRFFVDPSNQDMVNPNYVPGSTNPLEQPGFAQLAGCKAGRTCTLDNSDLERLGYGGFPEATRSFRGMEFSLSRAARGRFWFNLSYLRSKTEGNYRGRYFVESEERDPNLTEAFDVPALVVNTNGLLPQDRRDQVKLFGNWSVAGGFQVGATYRYASGTPVSTTTDPQGGSTPFFGPIYLTPRGNSGRSPATQNFDLSLTQKIKDGGKMTMTLYLNVFNVLNEQEAISLDEQFIATGLWRGAYLDFSSGTIQFAQEGRGEPYDGYIDQRFGNGDGSVTAPEWDRWAAYFEGRFTSTHALYQHLRKQMTTVNVNGTTYAVPAYPGFQNCPASLPDSPSRCSALNAGYLASRSLEPPRSVQLGVRIGF